MDSMVREFKIKNRVLLVDEPYIIAEAGINHHGDMKKAKMLIKAAAKAGADAVKFQTHIPDAQMLKETFTAGYVKESIYNLLKKVELSKQQHEELQKFAKQNKITFISTPFSKEAVDLLESIGVPFYKVGSGQITNIPLLEYIALRQKPMIISTGMTPFLEIKESVNFIKLYNPNFALMHCTSTYPTKYININLRFIPILKSLGYPVGISDHSDSIYPVLGAIPFGAQIIEKHFTVDKNWPGPDQKSSLEPTEFEEMIKASKIIYQSLGRPFKQVLNEEIPVQKMARESIVSIKDIKIGQNIEPFSNIGYKRPGTGIPAKYINLFRGKIARRDIKIDSMINWEDVEW